MISRPIWGSQGSHGAKTFCPVDQIKAKVWKENLSPATKPLKPVRSQTEILVRLFDWFNIDFRRWSAEQWDLKGLHRADMK